MTTDKMIIIYVTFPNKELAHKIIYKLLELKLIACANIFPKIESIYLWNGSIEKNEEFVAILKTSNKHYTTIEKYIKEHHDYKVPCIFSIKNTKFEKNFAKWIENSVNHGINIS
jgi:periplasmic divalent cation tolerance protein